MIRFASFIRRSEVPPLKSVNGAEVAFVAHAFFGFFIESVRREPRTGPFIPNMVFSVLQPFFIRNAFDEKFKFRRDEAEGSGFCCEQGKTLGHIMLEHGSGDGDRVHARAVFFAFALVYDGFNDVEIGLHGDALSPLLYPKTRLLANKIQGIDRDVILDYDERVLNFLHKEGDVLQQEWLRCVVLDSSSGILLFAMAALEHEKQFGPIILLDGELVLEGLVYHRFYSSADDIAADNPSEMVREFPASVRKSLLEAFELQRRADTHESKFLQAIVRAYEMLWALEMLRSGNTQRDFFEIMERHYGSVSESMVKFIGIRMLMESSMQEIAVLLSSKGNNTPQ